MCNMVVFDCLVVMEQGPIIEIIVSQFSVQ